MASQESGCGRAGGGGVMARHSADQPDSEIFDAMT